MDSATYLKHYGVKGMKWGVRKERPRSKDIRAARARQKARVAEYDRTRGTASRKTMRAAGVKISRAEAANIAAKARETRLSELSSALSGKDSVVAAQRTAGEKWLRAAGGTAVLIGAASAAAYVMENGVFDTMVAVGLGPIKR